MNFKKMITLIELLALTGVVSVGFSTWVIVETSFPEAHVQIETEKVVNTNLYLKIKNAVFSDYDSNGFFIDFIYSENTSTEGDNPGRSLTGYLEFDIEVDLSQCSYLNGKFNFDISIDTNVDGYSSNYIFMNACNSIKRVSAIYSVAGSTGQNLGEKVLTPLNGVLSDNTLSITTDNVSDYLILKLKYGFTFTDFADFLNCIKGPFNDGTSIPFNIVCYLGGN